MALHCGTGKAIIEELSIRMKLFFLLEHSFQSSRPTATSNNPLKGSLIDS